MPPPQLCCIATHECKYLDLEDDTDLDPDLDLDLDMEPDPDLEPERDLQQSELKNPKKIIFYTLKGTWI